MAGPLREGDRVRVRPRFGDPGREGVIREVGDRVLSVAWDPMPDAQSPESHVGTCRTDAVELIYDLPNLSTPEEVERWLTS